MNGTRKSILISTGDRIVSCFLVHLVFQVPFFPHQTSCVSCSCLLALPFLPKALQSVGAGCLLGAALHGVLPCQTSLCVTFVGFDTWPVMPCWQPLSHDRGPSGTAFPHSHPHRACGLPWLTSTQVLPCAHKRRPRSFRHEVCLQLLDSASPGS